MKIIHIATEDTNGAGLCCYRICKGQRSLGYDAEMLVLNKVHNDSFVYRYDLIKSLFFKYIKPRLVKRGITFGEERKIYKLQKKWNRFFTLPTSIFDLTKKKMISDAEIIHLHWVSGFVDFESFFSKFGPQKTIILTLHDENLFFGIAHYERDVLNDNYYERKYRLIKEKSLKKAKHIGVVFLSKMMYEKYKDNPLIIDCKKTIINNSVNYELYKPLDKAASRKKYGIDENIKIVAFCACWIYEERKGLEVLSKVLLTIDPKIKIIAIGRSNLPPNQRRFENVIPLGPCNSPIQMSSMLSCADIFCMPSYQEAFAQTPIEAMACGIPVVAFPCSGTEEIINEQTGVRCDSFTHDSLKTALTTALNKNYDHNLIREFVVRNFSPQVISRKYIDFYNSFR